MNRFLLWIDEVAGIEGSGGVARVWLERAAFVFLVLMTLSLPISIAATQIAWLTGMLLWLIRLGLKPRIQFQPGLIDYLIWAFFAWSVLSAAFSYAPDISFDKLRVVSLFLIVYFAYHNIRTVRAAKFLAGALILGAMIPVLWTPIERAIGRGVQIRDFQGSPFEQVGLADGDTILTVNGKKVSSLNDIREAANSSGDKFRARVYHADSYGDIEVPKDRIKDTQSAEAALSVGRWQPGRTWRAAGFYGHYTTFAEVLQLVMSLTFGVLASVMSSKILGKSNSEARAFFSIRVLAFVLAAMVMALILTATRASQLAFIVSAAVIVATVGSKRMIITAAAIALPLALVGLIVLHQTRGVGFFDPSDNSTTWRETVYREAIGLWTENARNFTVGVGMDSIKRYAVDWRLFDDGRLPMGHFHSTPLQIAVERGLPALLLWLAICFVYWHRLYRFACDDPISKGIVSGVLGGAIGFFVSGLVHYSLGDSEVAMGFFFLMALGLGIIARTDENSLTPDRPL